MYLFIYYLFISWQQKINLKTILKMTSAYLNFLLKKGTKTVINENVSKGTWSSYSCALFKRYWLRVAITWLIYHRDKKKCCIAKWIIFYYRALESQKLERKKLLWWYNFEKKCRLYNEISCVNNSNSKLYKLWRN